MIDIAWILNHMYHDTEKTTTVLSLEVEQIILIHPEQFMCYLYSKLFHLQSADEKARETRNMVNLNHCDG